MIKYHPYESMLVAFAAGELPTSLTIAVSAHAEMCLSVRLKLTSTHKHWPKRLLIPLKKNLKTNPDILAECLRVFSTLLIPLTTRSLSRHLRQLSLCVGMFTSYPER